MEQEKIIPSEAANAENVITALQKVITLLDRIKNSIEESSSKIPKASVQLDTVTEATELATVEILDVLELMGTKIHMVENGMKEFDQASLSERQLVMLTGMKQMLAELKENTSKIAIALQVQDITAQKINAANHLIESVRKELLSELNHFETAKNKADSLRRQAAGVKDNEKAFNGNASYMKAPEHQLKIDEVVTAWQEKEGK